MIPSGFLVVVAALTAFAQPPVLVPDGVLAGDPAALDAALAELGRLDAEVIDAGALLDRVTVVSVTGRSADADCGGMVALARWRQGVDDARARLQRLDLDGALDAYVALDLELPCLATAPGASDLVRVSLGLATAHFYLAESAGGDPARRRFHEVESEGALDRAAACARGLASPPDLDPELQGAFEAARRRVAGGDGDAVVLAGPPSGASLRVNGRPADLGRVEAAHGPTLVQVGRGVEVVAAALVQPAGRPTLVWVDAGGRPTPSGALVQDLAGFARAELAPDQEARLAGVLALLGDAWVVREEEGSLVAWAATDGRLGEVGRTPLARAPAGWRWAVGAGVGVGGSTLGAQAFGGAVGPPLDGLGGLGPSVAAWARWRAHPWAAVALGASPWGVGEALAVDQGGGRRYRYTVPVRLGARVPRPAGAWEVEAGADLGLHVLGRYDRARMGVLGLAAVGAAGPVGPDAFLRLELWGGAGAGYGLGGLTLGLEARP